MTDIERVRVHTHAGCQSVNWLRSDRSLRFPKLSAPVGKGGVNKVADVKAVQTALNAISPLLGGAFPKLAVDGDSGPLTEAAIMAFQRFHFPERYETITPDGRVDINEWTLVRLKDIYELMERMGENAILYWVVRRPARLLRARLGTGEAAAALDKALARLEIALRPLRDGATHSTQERDALRMVVHYFRLAGSPASRVMMAIAEIRKAFLRMKAMLDKRGRTLGIYTGGDIFEIDPKNEKHIAYSPSQTEYQFDLNPKPLVNPAHIYLSAGCDNISTDLFNHMIVHELLHMTDIETPGTEIVDKGYRADAFKLTHADSMRNADSYAMFVTHCHIGRVRMVAAMTALGPVVPADLR